jgi:predicted N-acetyltransferase YhbS
MQKPIPSPEDAASRAGVRIALATADDLPEVLRVQHTAFGRVAREIGIAPESMAPVAETLDDLVALRTAGVRTLVAFDGDRIVGTVRTKVREDGVAEIGRLAVDDGAERRGIGLALMLAVESDRPTTTRFELFTGAGAAGPITLYERLGYRIFLRERFERWEMVWLAKERAVPTVSEDAPLHWSA